MSEKKYKMLKKADGKLFFFSDHLAKLPGMVEVEMTKDEIAAASKPNDGLPVESPKDVGFVPLTTVDDKPGPGYIKNHKGKWVLPAEKKKKEKAPKPVKEGPEVPSA